MTSSNHWSQMKERGSLLGLKLLLMLYKYGGKYLVIIALYPVISYFFVTGRVARKASQQYLMNLYNHRLIETKPTLWTSYKHFLSMGFSALDKVDVWLGKISIASIEHTNYSLFEELLKNQQGGLIIGSHLGNLEVCRALSNGAYSTTFNVLVFTENAQKFNEFLNVLNPDVSINLIQVKEIGPDLAIHLKDKIEQGEFVVIAGDRTSTTNNERVINADFIGHSAPFAQGPFILAGLMQCPVLMMFCLKEENKFHIYLEQLSPSINWTRKTRGVILQQLVTKYANTLEKYCAKHPLQWFNFFDFWFQNKTKKDNIS